MSNGAANLRGTESTARPLSGSANEIFQRAERALAAGKLDQAEPLYRQLLAAGVQPGVQLHRLGLIANRRRDIQQAWDLHHQALAADPLLGAKLTPPDAPHHHHAYHPPYDTEDVPRCPVCDGDRQEALQVVNCLPFSHCHAGFDPVRRWVRCPDCGHGFANPRPSDGALARAFQDPPPAHLLQWSYDRLVLWSDIVHDLWQRRPGGDFLDVGTANGALAAVAQDFGYRVCGLDLHPAYARHARRLGVEFVQGDVCRHEFGGRQFDVVAVGDVIEHVARPRELVGRVLGLLRPGGLVWLSTPNYEGAWTRAAGDRDPMWLEGEHLQYFCMRSLRHLLGEYGLAAIDYRLSRRFVGCAEVVIERRDGADLGCT